MDDGVEWEDAPTYAYQAERALGLLEDMVGDGRPDPRQRVRGGRPGPDGPGAAALHLGGRRRLGVFTDVVAGYADVLGPTGVARLRGLIDEEVARLPRLVAGARPDSRHSTILELAERAARADGVDAVVDVLARDLSSAHRFERICQELAAAGRVEQALEWARRGLAELDEHVRGPDLRRTAAALAGELGRHGEAAGLVWQDFAACPSLEGYQRLREHGEADGSWSGWRDRALGELRALPAWQTAQDGGCAEAVWLTVARRRAEENPGDAIPVLRRHVEAAVDVAKRDGYERAAGLLTELGRCHERADTAAEFVEYVRALRARHRRKRNFIAALDAARLPG